MSNAGMAALEASRTQADAARWAAFLVKLILLSNLGLATAVPCGNGWTYDSSVGWCMQQVATPHNWSDARAHCSSLVGPSVGARAAGARLGALTTSGEAKAVSRFLSKLANFGDMWVAGRKVATAGAYQWVDQTPPANVTTGWGSSPDTRDCVYLRSVAKNVDGTDWKSGVELKTADCTEVKQFFCFYQAKRCNLGEIVGYNAETMDLQLQAANIGEATTANCRAGYYRSSAMAVLHGTGSSTATSSGTSTAPNSVNCTDTSTSSDPELAVPVWLQGTFEECLRVGCSTKSLTELGIQNALPFTEALNKNYKFGEGFNVTCKKGYVSSTDDSSKVARVSCMQDPVMTWLGMWIPSSSDVCSPIKCTSVQTLLANYSGVWAAKAFNAERNRWYSALEISQFSSYSTEVYIACNEVGLFFQDQKYERQLACDVENDTSTRANWIGIRGTFMMRGLLQNIHCIEVVCNLVDMFHQLDERGSVLNQWASYHINDAVTVYDAATHTVSNLTKIQLSSIGSFVFNSSISVTCPSDRLFVQSGTDQENLVLNLLQMTVTCSKTGKWNQTLGMCIEKTAAIQLLGRQKQYVPPAKEANAAWQMGTVTISIVIVFFACIVILDLATIKRDFNLLKTNLFYLQMRLKHL